MSIIFKYELVMPGTCEVMLPKCAEFLTAQIQGGRLMLWAMVDPEVEREAVKFAVMGTGWSLGDHRWHYVATVQEETGLVWHVLRLIESEEMEERE